MMGNKSIPVELEVVVDRVSHLSSWARDGDALCTSSGGSSGLLLPSEPATGLVFDDILLQGMFLSTKKY